MRARTWILLLIGLALFSALLVGQGLGEVAAAFGNVGWGLLVVAAFHLVPMWIDGIGLRCLMERERRPALLPIVRARWIGEAVNGLLPVAQVGGELVKTRLLMLLGVSGPVAGAVVVVALTLAIFAQLLFALLGVGLLGLRDGSTDVSAGVLLGLGVAGLAIGGFYLAQRRGLFRPLAHLAERLIDGGNWMSLVGGAEALDAAISRLWRNGGRVLQSAFWHLLGWVVGAGEVWLALHFLGHPVSITDALIIESLGQAARAAGFAIPAGLGVQEGGYMLAGRALGLDSETALAVSLVRRVRELLLGLPGLLVWQALEGRRVLRRRGAVADRST